MRATTPTQRQAIAGALLALLAGCSGSASLAAPEAAASGEALAAPDVAVDSSVDTSVAADGSLGDAFSATLLDGRCIRNAFPQGGACACVSSAPTPCADGCTDLEGDDENCGACGHACVPGATCRAGVCGPAPSVIEPARAGACKSMDVTVADGSLYWADQAAGTIVREPVIGGGPTILVSGEDAPSSIAVQGTTVYWLSGAPADPNEAGASLRSATVDGAPATTIVSPPDGVGGFTTSRDGKTIYFSTSTMVEKVPAGAPSTAPVVVAKEERGGLPRGLALDGTHLAYPTALNGDVDAVELADGIIARCGLYGADGTPNNVMCTRIGKAIDGPLSILAHDGKVYWPDGYTIKTNDIWPVPPTSYSVVGQAVNPIVALALFGGALVYADLDVNVQGSGTISTVALTPGAPSIRLARGQNAPRAVTSDGARVYWSTGDCAIVSTVP